MTAQKINFENEIALVLISYQVLRFMSSYLPSQKVVDKLSRTLIEKLQINTSTSAFFFWSGVFLIWFLTHNCDFLPTSTIQSEIVKGVLTVALFCFLVIVSSNLVEWATFPALRLFEGYWHPELDAFPLIGCFIRKYEEEAIELKKKLKHKRKILEKLDKRAIEEGYLSLKDHKKYNKIYSEISNYPEDESYFRPTKLGNIISAAEEYPYRHYGLIFNTIFPRLSLVLPEPFQKKVEESRKVLNERIRLGIWGLLFFTCSILPFIRCYDNWYDFVASIRWSFLIILIDIIGIITGITINLIFERIINSGQGQDIDLERLGVRWIGVGILFSFCSILPFIRFGSAEWNNEPPLILAIIVALATISVSIIVIALAQQVANSAALYYAEMLRSAFDLYRFNLYNELKWPLPIFPKTEPDDGMKLTQYLSYHSVSPGSKFKISDIEQSVQINTVQFELQDFQYLIEAGNKGFELSSNLANLDYDKIFTVISQVKQAFEKLNENENFFEILIKYPRHLENPVELFDRFIVREKELMDDAGLNPCWRDILLEKLKELMEKLSQLLNISDKVFPFLSWTDFQDIKSRKQEIEVIKSHLSGLESDLEELGVKVKSRLSEPQKIQETLDKIQETLNKSYLFLGGAVLVVTNCSTMVSRRGLNSQFSELSILLGSILLVKTIEITTD